MSYDLGVWAGGPDLTREAAGRIYSALCRGDASVVEPHPAVSVFTADFRARYPEVLEIDSDHSPAHLILVLRASFRDEVSRVVLQLADEHGLVVYDPQQDAILVTGQLEATGGAEPCSCLGKPGTPGGADSWRAYGAARKGCALHGDD